MGSEPLQGEVRAIQVLDTRGLYCPVPILRTREKLRHLAPGSVVDVLSDDPVILEDMPAFCRSHGHEYLGHQTERSGALRLRVRKDGHGRG